MQQNAHYVIYFIPSYILVSVLQAAAFSVLGTLPLEPRRQPCFVIAFYKLMALPGFEPRAS
jgi:hypothetical protein